MEQINEFEEALRNVIAELKAPKGQFNNFGKYKYRNAEDILEAVKPLLHKYNLRLRSSDKIVFVGERYYVECTVTVQGYGAFDTATGVARETETKKGMDEAQITGAAASYAKKYALGDMFDIDDTKDADTNEQRDQVVNSPEYNPARDEQESKIRAIAAQLGYTSQVISAKIATINSSDDAKKMIAKLEELYKEQQENEPKEPF